MAQPEKTSFLSRLARFVANPTTDWSALDSTLTDQQEEAAPDSAVPALSPAERQALRHQRRKHNRNIRINEFAVLRQIRAGASLQRTQSVPSSNQPEAAAAMPLPPSAPFQRATRIAGFNIDKIDHIEQQMAEQWWDKPGAHVAPPEPVPVVDQTPKTQMLIETQIGQFSAPAAVPESDVIAFDPAFFQEPVAPVASPDGASSVASPSAASLAQQEYVPAQGVGEQVDFSQAHNPAEATFVYRDVSSELQQDDSAMNPGMANEALPMIELPQLPLTDEEAQCMADAQAVQAELQSAGVFQSPIAIPPEYTVDDLPESLNEAAILFSQGRHEQVEAILLELASEEKSRVRTPHASQEPHVLLTLLDFYRCTEQEEKFEVASIEMVRHFDRSAPQYQSADLGEATRILSTLGSFADMDQIPKGSWRCPSELDLTDVMLLRSQLMVQPAQVLLDWQPLQEILDDAVEPLLDQFRDLAERKIDLLMWGSDHLLARCVQKLESTSVADPVYPLLWLLRLELVRILQGQEAFDELAMEYCVALEESPPSWVRTRCHFIDADNALSLLDSAHGEEPPPVPDMSKDMEAMLRHPLQWKGDLKGNLQALLQAAVDESPGDFCSIDCSQLDSMDYPAAAALLKWLMEPQHASRRVQFVQVNRLLAVFWRIMGITAKAAVELRRD